MLGRDDKNGIVWLYKATYEGLELRDCFFPDYELEEEPLGCRPSTHSSLLSSTVTKW